MTRYLLSALALILCLPPDAPAQETVKAPSPTVKVSAANDAPLLKVEAEPKKEAPQTPPHPYWFALVVGSEKGVGSGTPIYTDGKKTLVLTNAHVARPDREAYGFFVAVPGRGTFSAKRLDGANVITTGPSSIQIDGADVALVEVEADLGAASLAEKEPEPGEAVSQWGYGGTQPGSLPVLRTGRVTRSSDPENFTSTIYCVQGDSGCGVFNAAGQLCGVTSANGADYGGPSHFAVRLGHVKALTERPILSRLFPRLSERIAARKTSYPAAATPPPKTATAPNLEAYCPDGKCDPSAAPSAGSATGSYKVGNGPWMTAEQLKAAHPDVAGYLLNARTQAAGSSCPGGVCYPQATRYYIQGAGSCPGGNCPAPARR